MHDVITSATGYPHDPLSTRDSAESTFDISALAMQTLQAALDVQQQQQLMWWNSVLPTQLEQVREVSDRSEAIAKDLVANRGGADVLELDHISNGHALYFLGLQIFEEHDLISQCRINQTILRHLLLRVELSSASNPFHNSAHAADVLLNVHLFLELHALKSRLTAEELLVAFFAAIVHCFNHPGTSNAFEQESNSLLTQTFADQSAIEHYRLSGVLSLLATPGFELLSGLSHRQTRNVRALLVDVVLSTDMVHHNTLLRKLDVLMGKRGSVSPLFSSRDVDSSLLILIALKFAQLRYTAKSWNIHEVWANRMAAEFSALHSKRRAAGTVAAGQHSQLASQIGLLRFICLPLFDKVAVLTDSSLELCSQLEQNLRVWRTRARHASQSSGQPGNVRSAEASGGRAAEEEDHEVPLSGSEFDGTMFDVPFREVMMEVLEPTRRRSSHEQPGGAHRTHHMLRSEAQPRVVRASNSDENSFRKDSSFRKSVPVSLGIDSADKGGDTVALTGSVLGKIASLDSKLADTEDGETSSSTSGSFAAKRKVKFSSKIQTKPRPPPPVSNNAPMTTSEFYPFSTPSCSPRSTNTPRSNFLKRVFTFSPCVAHWDITQSLGLNSSLEMQTSRPLSSGIDEPSAFDFYAALLFVDISGFTPLCTLFDVDAVQGHINRFFTQLIEVISTHGGDVIRFAGDAILVAWSLPLNCSSSLKIQAARGACSCALQLISGVSYFIKQIDVHLRVSVGVGTGPVTGMRVGSPERWEFVLVGDPMHQVTEAERLAEPSEVVCSPQVWAYVKRHFFGTPVGEEGHVRVNESIGSQPFNLVNDEQVRAELLGYDLFTDTSVFEHEAIRKPLVAFVHETARELLESGHTHMAERRSIITAFCMIRGLENVLKSGADGLPAIQACIEAAMQCVSASGGLLRQFMLDDKGVVCIWNFGLSSNVFEDSAVRGLQSSMDVRAELAYLGFDSRIGLTSGSAFCGLVGSPSYRCEYGVMGASVNLAARLMCKAEDVLVNDELVREHGTSKNSLSNFTFEALDPIRVKGYSELVNIFRPRTDEMRQKVHDLLQPMEMFSTLDPQQQLAFLDAMQRCFFQAGEALVTEGELGDRLYVIVEGEVSVTKSKKKSLKRQDEAEHEQQSVTLRKGQFFGEMALLYSMPRSATVTAITPTICASIDRETFLTLIDGSLDMLKRTSSRRVLDGEKNTLDETLGDSMASRQSGQSGLARLKKYSQSLFAEGSRHEEGEVLAAQVESLLATGMPSLTSIAGEAGMGKTHLLSSLRKTYAGAVPIVFAQASEQDQATLTTWFHILRMILATACHLPLAQLSLSVVLKELPSLNSLNASALQRLQSIIEESEFNSRISLGRPRRSSSRTKAFMLSMSTSSERASASDQEIMRPAADDASLILSVIKKVVEGQPFVVIIDDAHHFDSLSWALLLDLLQRQLPIAVILAARTHAFRRDDNDSSPVPLEVRQPLGGSPDGRSSPLSPSPVNLRAGEHSGEIASRRRRTSGLKPTFLIRSKPRPGVVLRHLELQPIDAGQVKRILQAKCGESEAPPDVVTRGLSERSGGNPMFLLQMLSQIQEMEAAAGHPFDEVKQLECLSTLPASIHDSVLSSFATASVGFQSILKVASVLACPGLQPSKVLSIENAMLLGLHAGPVSDVTDIFNSHELARFLIRDSGASVPSVRFRSSVVCEVIYSLLLRSQRQQTHALAARWLERLQQVRPDGERRAVISWHWLKSTTERHDGLRFSTVISLFRAKTPWTSPPSGVAPAVMAQMGGHDIQARLELVPVMDLDSIPDFVKITDAGLAKNLDEADRLADLSDLVVQPHTHAVPLVMITNQTDPLPLVFAKTLISMRAIQLKAVIVNLRPCLKRARRARQILDSLGLSDVPVGVGADVISRDSSLFDSVLRSEQAIYPVDDKSILDAVRHRQSLSDTPRRMHSGSASSPGNRSRASSNSPPGSPSGSFRKLRNGHIEYDGYLLLCETYRNALPGSLTLLVISAMTDVARLIREEQELFVAKTRQVVVMGGVLASSLQEESGSLVGDDTARNHLLDTLSANYVFRLCQEIGVQLLVVTRYAAYGCPMPFFFYDELASRNDLLALEARDRYHMGIQHLWRQLRMPDTHRERAELPARCDLRWFYDTFCGGTSVPTSEVDIAPNLATVMLHDVIALLACCPDALDTLFEVELKNTLPLGSNDAVCHMCVGVSNKKSGIADGRQIRALFNYGLRIDALEREKTSSGNDVSEPWSPDSASSNDTACGPSPSSSTDSLYLASLPWVNGLPSMAE